MNVYSLDRRGQVMDTGEFCVKSGSVNCVIVMFIS